MSAVEVSIEGSVATVRLNRPDVLNALNQEAYEGLAKAVQFASQPSVRAVLLTGTGRGFCAGHDLKDSESDDPAVDLPWVNATMSAIRGLPKPVIAAINGIAVGGGLSLALACDYKLMARTAKLIPGFIDMGLVPDMGASWLLANTLGYGRAFEWLSSGRPLDAQIALEWGLVDALEEEDRLLESAREKARELAARPTLALGLTKQLLARSLSSSFEQAMEQEARLQGQAGKSQDYAESLAAFREKREPDFKGQ